MLNLLTLSGFSLHPLAAIAEGIFDLGTLNNGSWSRPTGMSADGSIIVGTSKDGPTPFLTHAFRWTNASGMVSLGGLNSNADSEANAISADGKTIVGSAVNLSGSTTREAFRWTAESGMVSLGTLGGSTAYAYAVSANGNVIVGESRTAVEGQGPRAFRWTSATGMESLGTLSSGDYSSAKAVSADGNIVVGVAGAFRAFRWTASGGMVDLGSLNGDAESEAAGISADGSIIVGTSGGFRAFRWTAAEGMANLGTLNGGNYAFVKGISPDGQVIVGIAADGSSGNAYRGFRWSAASGMQSVEQWLSSNNVTVGAGLVTKSAIATNSDGSIITGQLENNHAYIARLSPLGSGLIDTTHYAQTLYASADPQRIATYHADIVVHGLHGSPMRGLPKTGGHNAWVAGDIGRQDHFDNRGNIDAGEAGYAYGLSDGLTLKMAIGRTYSDNRLIENGNTSVRGTYLFPKLIYAVPDTPLYVSASFYYNLGEANLRRGYINAGTQDYSRGKTDTQTSAVRLRLDWVDAFSIAGAAVSPYAGLTQYRSQLGAFTESGGGFPVRWNRRSEIHTQSRIGFDAIYKFGNDMNLIGRLEAIHRFEAYGGTNSGEVLGLGSFSFSGQANKQDWLRAGFGFEKKTDRGVLSLMVNATTESPDPSFWVFANYRFTF